MRREKFTEPWGVNRTIAHTTAGISNTMSRSFDSDPLFEENKTQEQATELRQEEATTATISHSRARELLQEQTRRLLPPQEANVLADHLLICDRCFRYAQDIAHQERQSGKHTAVHGEEHH